VCCPESHPACGATGLCCTDNTQTSCIAGTPI
jgi:hypothetical protein